MLSEDVTQRKLENKRRQERDREVRELMRMIMGRHTPEHASYGQKTQDIRLGGWSETLEHGVRREGREASKGGRSGECAHAREGRGWGNLVEQMVGARLERPTIDGSTEAAAIRHNDESMRTISYDSFDHYSPYHMKIPPPNCKGSLGEYLGCQQRFLRFSHLHDLAKASLADEKIRLGDPSVTIGDAGEAACITHRESMIFPNQVRHRAAAALLRFGCKPYIIVAVDHMHSCFNHSEACLFET